MIKRIIRKPMGFEMILSLKKKMLAIKGGIKNFLNGSTYHSKRGGKEKKIKL